MTSPATPSYLRLVGGSEPPPATPRMTAHARQAVAQENRAAGTNAHLSPTDPRWVLAVRAYSQLEGSTLRPERRERVMRTAKQLGLRTFDANLVIAVVQDHARRHEPLSAAVPTLQVIDPPAPPHRSAWTRWIGATILAVLANLILIWWLIGGV